MAIFGIDSVMSVTTPYPYNPEPPDGASQNVIDKYKSMMTEAIRLDLDDIRSELINVYVNTGHDFNLSSGIRSGNAFAVKASIVAGRRKFDRRGTVGTHHYEHVLHASDIFEVIKALKNDGYTVIPVDNTPEFQPRAINHTELPVKTAFVYGEEGAGLSREVVAACNGNPVFLEQRGSVRSINVAVAASICMYEYNRQHSV